MSARYDNKKRYSGRKTAETRRIRRFITKIHSATYHVRKRRSKAYNVLGCVFLGESKNGFVISDHSDHGASKERPTNPCPEWIRRFLLNSPPKKRPLNLAFNEAQNQQIKIAGQQLQITGRRLQVKGDRSKVTAMKKTRT